MNSLRRPHHIRMHDLRNFMHSYDPASGKTPEEWARQISAGLKQGCLIFLLEPIAAPLGLASFARKEDDENFRVTELATVVRLEDNKAMALSATSTNYELRFLAVLLEEKARKAVLDHRKLCFVLAKPAVQLTLNKIGEIEKLSNLYAQGGSRRDFMSDEADPEQEPVIAVFRACGVHLHWTDSNKQPADPGSICYLLFTPEGRHQDNNRDVLKTNFVPMQLSESNTAASSPEATRNEAAEAPRTIPPLPNNIESTSEFLLSSWGQTPPSPEIAANSTLLKRLTNELAKKKPQQDDPLALPHRSSQNESAPDSNTKTVAKDEVYQHISEAISGLLDTEVDLKQSNDTDRSAKWVANQIEAHREEIEQKRGADKLLRTENKSADTLSASELPMLTAEGSKSEQQALEPDLQSTAPVDFALLDIVTTGNQPIVFPAIDTVPTKLDDFQEPKVVMNEMASLMNKLESQVARAAKKLTSRTATIEEQLMTNMTAILSTINHDNKDMEAQLVINGDSLTKQFESLFESLKLEVAEKSASAREQIQTKRTEEQSLIEESEQEHHEALTAALNQNQTQFGQMVQDKETQLENLVKAEAEKLRQQLEDSTISLQQIADRFADNLSEQLHSFEKRVDEEMSIIIDNLDTNTNLLSKNIVMSCQHGLEKLNKIKDEFETNLKHLVDTTEIALGRQIRLAQIEFFLPRLKEHKQLIETMMQEMEETFAQKLLSQSQSQLEGLISSLDSARSQLQELRDECLTKLDLIGRNQQSGLEELFATASNSLVQNTEELVRLLKQAEQEIADSDAVCKKLAETYSLDNDPAVTSLRQNISNRVDGLKSQVKNELESVVNNDCAALEDLIRNQHSKLNSRRAELAQRVHFASDHGLQRIRAAIHDAFNAIQSERETYME